VAATTVTLLRGLLRAEELIHPVAWLYTPMAMPLLDAVNPAFVIYDCMDGMSLFLGAPPDLVSMEAALLERADLVFTGGVSLYQAKRKRRAHVGVADSLRSLAWQPLVSNPALKSWLVSIRPGPSMPAPEQREPRV
jgi:hypothetical protein